MYMVYVAGPYRNRSIRQIVENIRRAEEIAVQLYKMGFSVICPHKNTGLIDGDVTDAEIIASDNEQIKRCDFMVVMPNWQKSEGTRDEISLCMAEDIPIFFWESEEDRDLLLSISAGKYEPADHPKHQLFRQLESRMDRPLELNYAI